MGHIGIIAEYNPFHNGHFYQIQEVKKAFPDKEVLVVMSGNYVQRGEPAIFNKYIRTKMALAGGGDMVIELPSFFSTQSAELFARSAVLSLYKTGIIDTICFGAECKQKKLLYQIADLLVKEPEPFQKKLQELLARGLSFPKARSMAVFHYMKDEVVLEILCRPNNILAIEYLKAIRYYHLPIKPYIIERSADNYHNGNLPACTKGTHDDSLTNRICSATALRKGFLDSGNNLSRYIPEPSYRQLTQYPYRQPLAFSDFYGFLQEKLMHTSSLSLYQDVSKEFANRLSGFDLFPYDLDSLLNTLSCKNMTNTRICRGLMHIMLNHKKNTLEKLESQKYILYFRILGFRNTSTLPKLLKEKSTLPIITKVSNYKKQLTGAALQLFENEIQADHYYRQVYYNKYKERIPSEYEHSVIIYHADKA